MGSGASASRKYPDGILVMMDVPKTGNFAGAVAFGSITGAQTPLARTPTATWDKSNFEYTVAFEDLHVETVEEQYIRPLRLKEFQWVSPQSRDVAVRVQTHVGKQFLAQLVRRDKDMMFVVKFAADKTVLEAVRPENISEPNGVTIRDGSPQSTLPSLKVGKTLSLRLLDRKIQADIDTAWPMHMRIRECLSFMQVPRASTTAPITGPFVGVGALDSEAYPACTRPPPDLMVDRAFQEKWANYAGNIKFASTHAIGHAHPEFSTWVESIDAADPLYFHAALPVYAGLLCLGKFEGFPEFIQANDIALIGIALYVNGKLWADNEDPPLEESGLQTQGHECCNFMPGCIATYLGDCAWMGGVFCLGPQAEDERLMDDIHSIVAYHKLLAEAHQRYGDSEILLEANLVISTNYLANLRQVCCGAVRINLSEKSVMQSDLRLKELQDRRAKWEEAPSDLHRMKRTKTRGLLSEMSHEQNAATLARALERSAGVGTLDVADPSRRDRPSSASRLRANASAQQSADAMSREEFDQEKLFTVRLVITFVQNSLQGCPCTYIAEATGERCIAHYFLDEQLQTFIMAPSEGWAAKCYVPLFAIRESYCLVDVGKGKFPNEVVNRVTRDEQEMLLRIVYHNENGEILSFCLLEVSAHTRDLFLEGLRILRMYMSKSLAESSKLFAEPAMALPEAETSV